MLVAGVPGLPGVLAGMVPVLDRYGYAAVAVLIMLEGFGLPAPGQTVLVASAVYAGSGRLDLAAVVVVATAAAVAGDNIGYAIGHFGGRRLVLRFGRHVFLTERRLARAERFFARRGAAVVAAARFVDGLRQANGIIAGTTGMRWRRFLAFNALGAALWVAVWAGLGYLAGRHIEAIFERFHRFQLALLAALALLVAALVVRGWRRRAREDTGGGQGSKR